MSPKPKRVRAFIRGGQIYAGGIEEAFGTATDLGGLRDFKEVGNTPSGSQEDTSK